MVQERNFKMDFYKYIHSKDVAEHLKKTNFHLNSLQCLWIVYQNDMRYARIIRLLYIAAPFSQRKNTAK